MKLAKCKIYASANAFVTLNNATYIGETLFAIPEIFNVSAFLGYIRSNRYDTIIQNGSTNTLYNNINAVSELSSAAFRLQYNSGGDMRVINQIRNRFTTFIISTSTEYGALYYDFGGEYYIREANNGTSSLVSKATGSVIQALPTRMNLILGCYQFNTSYNNISFATLFYDSGKLIPVTFDVMREYLALRISRPNTSSPYLPDVVSQYILNSYSPDPYADIPASGPSTPSGTFDFTTSDKIGVPALPSLSAVSTGFVSLWSPTEAQMLQLSSFMWNANPLTIEFWKKIVADPMQLIYGLNIVPLDLDALGMIDSTGEVVVGLISTGVSMNHLSRQWVELDCGTVTLDETWSAYLDYDPYTKLEIYLPYCGTHPLRVDDFMPGTVKLTYHIDLLSGACVAILTATKSDKHGDTLDSVVYQFMGNCAAQIPVTASQYADAVRSVIQLAASIGTMIAGAAGAGAAVAAETSALPASAGLAISSGAHQASAMVENVMGIKPNVERSGAIGATGGLLSVQKPYLILTRPRQARPKDQNTYTGYPSFITETLSDLEGWTQLQAIHLEAIPCTADELAEIDELLKSGVIF